MADIEAASGADVRRPYQVCARCIMDTSDPDIEFDESGVCNHCRTYFHRVEKEVHSGAEGRHRLDELVEKVKADGRGKDYDCVIGVSGGVDSSFVAYKVKQLGLRPIAVHFDNGWNSELAVQNIKQLLDKLGIDLYTYVVDWSEFRDLQRSFLRASVPNCEIPTDHAIYAVLFRIAAKYRLRYLITGGNVTTEGIMPLSWGYYSQDLHHLKAIHRRFGSVPLRTFPRLGLARFLYHVFVRRVRMIPILNYFDYNKAEAMRVLQEDLGWRYYGGKHYESIFTRFFQGYYLPRKFGFDKRRAHLSTLVCSGQIGREAALKEMQQSPYGNLDPEVDRDYVVKKFGLTEQEFDDIMHAPPGLHMGYPSHAMVYEGLSGLRKVFKRIATRP